MQPNHNKRQYEAQLHTVHGDMFSVVGVELDEDRKTVLKKTRIFDSHEALVKEHPEYANSACVLYKEEIKIRAKIAAGMYIELLDTLYPHELPPSFESVAESLQDGNTSPFIPTLLKAIKEVPEIEILVRCNIIKHLICETVEKVYALRKMQPLIR